MNDKKVLMKTQDPNERIHNFKEVELGFNDNDAKMEASRCLNCKNPRCVTGCPVNIDIPSFIKQFSRISTKFIKLDGLLFPIL